MLHGDSIIGWFGIMQAGTCTIHYMVSSFIDKLSHTTDRCGSCLHGPIPTSDQEDCLEIPVRCKLLNYNLMCNPIVTFALEFKAIHHCSQSHNNHQNTLYKCVPFMWKVNLNIPIINCRALTLPFSDTVYQSSKFYF